MAVPVTNIELYEALKQNLNEDAARMIAEVVPKATDLATKSDISELKSHIDSRLLRSTWFVLAPLMATMLGTVGALVGLVVKF